jgi:hypothetical protein
MTFGLGLAAVFMWQGISIARREVPVDLPKTQSGDTIAVTVPPEKPQLGPKFLCDEFSDENERNACLDKVIFENREKSLYGNGGDHGCGLREYKSARQKCEYSMEQARRFVWDHWKKRKRGYVAVKFDSGNGSYVRHLFIEPKEDGEWRVAERMVPMLREPEDPEHYWLGDLVEITWYRATNYDKRDGLTPGSLYLRLSNGPGDSLIL